MHASCLFLSITNYSLCYIYLVILFCNILNILLKALKLEYLLKNKEHILRGGILATLVLLS